MWHRYINVCVFVCVFGITRATKSALVATIKYDWTMMPLSPPPSSDVYHPSHIHTFATHALLWSFQKSYTIDRLLFLIDMRGINERRRYKSRTSLVYIHPYWRIRRLNNQWFFTFKLSFLSIIHQSKQIPNYSIMEDKYILTYIYISTLINGQTRQ